MTDLPPPRGPGRYRLGLVCLGNICRSPMAATVLSALVEDAGLDRSPEGRRQVEVTSCGTGAWHVGEAMDPRAAAALRSAGYDGSRHRARRLDPFWDDRDVLLAMDLANLRDTRAVVAEPDRVLLFRDFDPARGAPGASPTGADAEVPDPYFGGDDGFAVVLAMVERTGAAIVERLTALV